MAREYSSHIGSGTVPFIGGYNPDLSGVFPNGRFPSTAIDGKLSNRTGTGAVVLNFEDASIFMGFAPTQINVDGSPLPLPANPLVNRRSLAICNLGPGILYIGKSDVTTSTGFPVFVNDKIAIDCQGNENVKFYGVSDGTSDVRVLELG